MANATSTFNQKLANLYQAYTDGDADFIQTLTSVTDCVYAEYNVNVWFVEIFGRRWSHIAGNPQVSFMPPQHLRLSEKYGMLTDGWENIPEDKRNEFVTFLQRLINEGLKTE